MQTDVEPNDIPTPVLEQGWENDTASTREFENWDQLDRLSRQKKENELKFHKALGWCIPVGIGLVFISLAASLVVYLIHVLGPVGWRWLSPEEIQYLHSVIFSGLVGAALGEWIRSYLKKGGPS